MSAEPGDPRDDQAARGAHNVAVLASGRLAIHAVGVLTTFVVPRVMGAEAYGRYGAALAVVQILVVASAMGLPLVEMRFLAPAWRSRRGDALALGSTVWLVRLALSALAGLLAFGWLQLAPALGFGVATCALLGLLCAGRAATEAARGLLFAVGRVGAMMRVELMRVCLALPIIVVAFRAADLEGVFAGLPLLYAVLLPTAALGLRRTLPVAPAHFRWGALAPHVGFSLRTTVGTLAGVVQSQFAVFAVASFVAAEEAGYLAFAVQLYALVQGLVVVGVRGVTPLLSELEQAGESRRLAAWGGVMLRYGSAALCLAAVAWGLVGADLVRVALTPAFLPAHACGTWMLLAAAFFCVGGSANGILYVRGRAGTASANLVLFAAATIAGLALAALGPEDGTALRISRVYAGASALFAVSAVATLAAVGRLRLPLARVVPLLAPAALALPAALWAAPFATRLAALAGFALVYAGVASATGLLPLRELRALVASLRAGRAGAAP